MKPFRSLFCLMLCGALLAAVSCESQPDSADGTPSSGRSSLIPSASSEGSASVTSDTSETAGESEPSNASSEAISSAAPVQASDYYDVDAAFKTSGKKMTDDVSSCFPATAKAYQINGGTASQPYLVDAATLQRLTAVPVKGTGYVRWVGYQVKNKLAGERAFDGVIPVSKLNDPIYTCMNLPAESNYYECNLSAGASWGASGSNWNNRVNGFNMTPVDDTFNNILCMGAIYPALDENRSPLLDPDDEFTLCIGNFHTLCHSTDAGLDWTAARYTAAPPVNCVNHLYTLPWSSGSAKTVPTSDVTVGADHTEIRLKGSDLLLGNGGKIEGYTFHFWDKKVYFSDLGVTGGQIDGFVLAATVWVKEPGMAGKLVATIGADIRYNDEKSKETKGAQLNSSRAYLIPASPRVVVSHNVGPNDVYDSVMDTEAVQKLLGMK